MPVMTPGRKRELTRQKANAAMRGPADTGQSVDEIDIDPPERTRRRTARTKRVPTRNSPPPKAATPHVRRGRRPNAPPPNPEVRHEEDDTVPMRALGTRAGQGGRRRVDPTAMREPMRDPHTGRIIVVRDGVTFTRRHTNTGDKFHIDQSDIPEGWSYQWIAVSVLGAGQRNSIQNFKGNVWVEVMTTRYPGRYAPESVKEHIVLDGLGLYERPEELTKEARGEEIQAARDLIRTRNDQFVPRLPEARKHRGTELRAKRSIEGMPGDIGRPVYQMDVDDGLL
jgi:hypothetical protein